MDATETMVSLLRRTPLFAGFSEATLRACAVQTTQRRYERNEIIFHRDDPGSSMYIVEDGQVKIGLVTVGGDDVTLDILRPGEIFGELSLLDGLPRSATATALGSAAVLMVTREGLLTVLAHDPDAAGHIMAMIGRRIRRTNEIVEDIIMHDTTKRVARKLIDLATTHGVPLGDGIAVGLRLTQQDLASMIGATRESTNRVLRAFVAKGWIAIVNHTIIIRHQDDLRQYAS